jgi:hypothetical protein
MMKIKILPLVRVQSSAFTGVGYDGRSKMHIKFNDGAVHEYSGVTPEAYSKLMNAKSLGSHFLSQIRDRYNSRRLI